MNAPGLRRPFLFLLVLIVLYCWFKDFVNFFFYIVGSESTSTGTYSYLIGLFIFLAVLYGLKVTFFKKISATQIKEIFQPHRKKEWLLLLLVSLPIIALGLIRAVFPDQNYDTIHYELYLQDFDYIENKRHFAPGGTATYIFHLSEIFSGLFRHLLGYRLGSIFNIFLAVTIIVSVYDFIKKFISVYAPLRTFSIVSVALLASFAIFADNAILIFGSYKTDLIGIPLLIELLFMIFFGGKYSDKLNYAIFFVLSSLIIALKLTFLPYVAILGFIYFIKNYKSVPPLFLFSIPFVILLFPAPCLLYSILETGNPLFPFYNKIFHSAYYPDLNFKDIRFGPGTKFEALFYHIITLFNPEKRNEWMMYSYRLLFGFLISIGIIVFYVLRYKKNKYDNLFLQISLLCIVVLLFDYAWAITTGISRYASANEIMYGIVIALLCMYVREKLVSVFLVFMVLFQFHFTFQSASQLNMSWHNYASLFKNKELRHDNIEMLLQDYGRITDNSNILPKVDAFIIIPPCVPDGLARLLNKKAAIYDLTADRTKDSVDLFEKNVVRVQSQNKNFMVIAYSECWGYEFINSMNKKGFLATDMYEVYPDFMKANEPVLLFKIKYLDTSKYTIHTTQKFVMVGDHKPSDSAFTFHSDHKVKAFVREAPYLFDWPLNVYELNINDRKYKINSKSKANKIFALDTNNISITADQPKNCLVLVQEIEENKPK